jgi:hypothetical protein
MENGRWPDLRMIRLGAMRRRIVKMLVFPGRQALLGTIPRTGNEPDRYGFVSRYLNRLPTGRSGRHAVGSSCRRLPQ